MSFTDNEILNYVEQHGYPLYLYDSKVILQKINEVKKIDSFEFLYSMKCNPNSDVVKFMIKNDIGIDAASFGEVKIARNAGAKPNKILFSTPGKRLCDIQRAIGECFIVADSLSELSVINEAATEYVKKNNKKLKIGVRLNPINTKIDGNAKEVMSGGSSKFGIDVDLLHENIEWIKSLINIEISGIHIYFGSQILEEDIVLNNVRIISKTVIELLNHFEIELVDFGGGFGVKIENSEKDFSMTKLNNLLSGCDELNELKKYKLRLIFESGRFLVSESGEYVSKVVDTKISCGEKYVIVYGGMNGFFRPSFMNVRHQIRSVVLSEENRKANEYENVHIAGNLCTPIDMFAKDATIKKAETNDLIIIENAGAYGFTMSLTDFISHDKPKEIFVNRECNCVN